MSLPSAYYDIPSKQLLTNSADVHYTQEVIDPMIIDFFSKDKGLQYLQAVYHLSDIQAIRNKVYCERNASEVDAEPLASMFGWIGDTKSIKTAMSCSTHPQYILADDAIEIFLRETGIQPDTFDLSDLHFRCIHLASTIDGGKSIKEKGLLKLVDLLAKPSPLSSFLLDYDIVIKPEEKIMIVNGERQCLENTDISIKLYSTNSAIEAFIAGEIGTLQEYSCISDAPEVLREISAFVYGNYYLIEEWRKKKNKLVHVIFDVSFEECANIGDMSFIRTPDHFEMLLPFCKKRYEFSNAPESLWQNFWFIHQCLKNACPGMKIDQSMIVLKPDVKLGSERIRVHEV